MTGSTIGPKYFKQWLANHIEKEDRVFVWLNTSEWPNLNMDSVYHGSNPMLLRLGNSQVLDTCELPIECLDLQWSRISELHAFVNQLVPDLATNEADNEFLTQMLHWIWLHPSRLCHFPQWSSNSHRALLFAGELAPLLLNANPFNPNNLPAPLLSIEKWMDYAGGIIIFDDGTPQNEKARLCVQAWIRSYLGHRLGVPLLPPYNAPSYDLKSCSFWYIANIQLGLITPVGAQCRALGIAFTYFYSEEPTESLMYPFILANTATQLREVGPNEVTCACNGKLFNERLQVEHA